jgi:hypothetical protein
MSVDVRSTDAITPAHERRARAPVSADAPFDGQRRGSGEAWVGVGCMVGVLLVEGVVGSLVWGVV